MRNRNFMDLLQRRWDEGKSVCVGLDTDAAKIPVQHLLDPESGFGLQDLLHAQAAFIQGTADEDDIDALTAVMLTFNKAIVDETHDLVCAFKPNSAFYEALGSEGVWVLGETIAYIHEHAPEVPVILDYKRGDIGNTNSGYVQAAAAADAVTVQPYFGFKAMEPFLDQKDMGIIVLVKTSNPGSGEFQDLFFEDLVLGDQELIAAMDPLNQVKPKYLYEVVAHNVATAWNYNGNCCVVVGATYPDELAKVRKIVGDMPILIPGIGAQGGELEATVLAGRDSNGQGMIINSSRGIIFASDGEDFAEAAKREALKLHEQITTVLAAV